jgi:hypothetical protein
MTGKVVLELTPVETMENSPESRLTASILKTLLLRRLTLGNDQVLIAIMYSDGAKEFCDLQY